MKIAACAILEVRSCMWVSPSLSALWSSVGKSGWGLPEGTDCLSMRSQASKAKSTVQRRDRLSWPFAVVLLSLFPGLAADWSQRIRACVVLIASGVFFFSVSWCEMSGLLQHEDKQLFTIRKGWNDVEGCIYRSPWARRGLEKLPPR